MEFAVNQDIAGRMWRGLQQLVRNAEVFAKLTKSAVGAKTLRAQFQQEAVASDGFDNATGAGRGFDELGVDAGFAE